MLIVIFETIKSAEGSFERCDAAIVECAGGYTKMFCKSAERFHAKLHYFLPAYTIFQNRISPPGSIELLYAMDLEYVSRLLKTIPGIQVEDRRGEAKSPRLWFAYISIAFLLLAVGVFLLEGGTSFWFGILVSMSIAIGSFGFLFPIPRRT